MSAEDHGLYPSPNNFEPYTDQEVRLTKAIEAVMAVADDLGTRGDSLVERGNNGSIYSLRTEGRGLGYQEGRRLIRAAIENALKEQP
jgi:hypothetical protein